MPDIDDDQISQRAHALWEQAGRPDGLDQHFWFSARRELLAEEPSSSVATPVEMPQK